MNMRNAVWRNRAIAILGGLVFLVAIFSGFPGMFDRLLYGILGFVIMLLGFAGSRRRGTNVTPIASIPPTDPNASSATI